MIINPLYLPCMTKLLKTYTRMNKLKAVENYKMPIHSSCISCHSDSHKIEMRNTFQHMGMSDRIV